MPSLLRAAYWAAPPLLALLLYWDGLHAWFAQDDFAWLGLGQLIHSWQDVPGVLFRPMAQGTIRTISERLYFLALFEAFGLNALPYRLVVFATQFVNLALITLLTLKLTRSRTAGLLAPLLWLCNASLVTVMTWTSAYNQALCALVLLGSLLLFIRYTETGDRRWYVAQWITFLLGFGVLELNVVYPALAFAYAILLARPYWRAPLWMLPVSVVYAVVHRLAGADLRTDTYRLVIGPSMLDSLAQYGRWLVGVDRAAMLREVSAREANLAMLAIVAVLLGFAWWRARQRDYAGLFCWAWFFLILGPVLPLRNHVSVYYLTIPSIGLAILGAWGLVAAWRTGWPSRVAAGFFAVLYLSYSITPILAETRAARHRSLRGRMVLESLLHARQQHPDAMLLLKGVDDEVFWVVLYDRALRLVGLRDVYTVEDDLPKIHQFAEAGNLEQYFVPSYTVRERMRRGQAEVYQVGEHQLRNVTRAYYRALVSRPEPPMPRRVELAQVHLEEHLGPGWHAPEENLRWIGKEARVTLGGPPSPRARLVLAGYAPGSPAHGEPLSLRVCVEAAPCTSLALPRADAEFSLSVPAPTSVAGSPQVPVRLQVSRTFRGSGDQRDLGIALRSVAFQ